MRTPLQKKTSFRLTSQIRDRTLKNLQGIRITTRAVLASASQEPGPACEWSSSCETHNRLPGPDVKSMTRRS